MLEFEIDASQIEALVSELGVTEKQAKFALSRALRRTAATLRRLSERGLKSELNIKKSAYLRRRLKSIAFKSSSFQGTRLWFGMNDMPISSLRGRIEAETSGATFTGKAGSHTFAEGFITKSRRGYGRTIMTRKGKARLPIEEARLPVKNKMDEFLEDKIFDKVPTIFWSHFERDLRARANGFGRRD